MLTTRCQKVFLDVVNPLFLGPRLLLVLSTCPYTEMYSSTFFTHLHYMIAFFLYYLNYVLWYDLMLNAV